ncbi:MAG TPA: AgmX/PglI C-terminal domain-containing protein [Marinobacter sp.]|uniref:AgmX/PglI C-terminal domain-containing protein n=1 Tax=Marinobacter sp. TaxID=50741 RepID=UPI0026103566|nr:AgmX/PglI C-terminal domain-containing protein [Marinobacter sp.]HET8801342.1 AgmX/PglI C-terminal domain-containing protein [Marinobacter sp.]
MAERIVMDNGAGLGLPWNAEAGENRRFGGILLVIVLAFLAPAVLIPGLNLPEPDRETAERVPPRLVRLIEHPAPVELPEPEAVVPEPEPEPDIQAPLPPETATVTDVPKPAPQPEPEPVMPAPQPSSQSVEQARATASRSGLLAMKDRLASLRQAPTAEPRQFQANTGEAPVASSPAAGADQVLAGSGGVDELAAPDIATQVAAYQVKEVAMAPEPAPRAAEKVSSGAPSGERAMSNIRKVFAAHKTALYSLYRRELRQDPTLAGKVLLELVIEPDGSVSACDVVSSELDNPGLEQRIAMRVRLFNFGADEVGTRKVRFPIDFLPG